MNTKLIVIGCGTGRSGTLSLARILDQCRRFTCTHEKRPLLPWNFNDETYRQKKRMFLAASGNIGDVHSAYLPYLERFIEEIPSIKIVCTRRDCHEVAESFERHIANGLDPNRHHWYEHEGRGGWNLDPEWDPAFPKYKIKDRKKAILRYAEDYDRNIDELIAKHPENIMVVRVDELSSYFSQNRILRFVGIRMVDRRFTRKINSVLNASRAQPSQAR